MKKLLLISSVFALASAVPAHADGVQTVTVNGSTATQDVEKITFRGDYVTLFFSDGTTEVAEMDKVTITFTVADALKALSAERADAPTLFFDISGKQLKKAPAKGSYIMKKGNKIVKLLRK